MLIYTGDTHGDFTKLYYIGDHEGITRKDYVVVCGDFGGIWSDSTSERKARYWLSRMPYTLLFVSGNHENFDLLAEYPVTEWNGGKVQFISENVIHLMRGQVFTLGERKLFTMGGASSHDIQDGILNVDDPDFHQKRKALDDRLGMYRIDHISWWKQELAEGLKIWKSITGRWTISSPTAHRHRCCVR